MLVNMKEMLNLLKQFMENNAENVIDFCMSDENFEGQIKTFKEVQNKETVHSTEEIVQKREVNNEDIDIEAQNIEEVSVSEKRIPFWKRLFGKK